jgi:cyclopropane-fatty-acyl-phospholipid synthase
MKSLIYSGKVMHERLAPVGYRWTLPYCFYAIDLDELPLLDSAVRGFGYNRRAPLFLRDRDYLAGGGGFRERLAQHADLSQVERIVLVTVPGLLVKVFNPVSFYYCLRGEAEAVCILAEVNNTFGDRCLYRLDAAGRFPVECRHEKRMHVSPFNDMRGHYEFRFSAPAEEIDIQIRLVRDGRAVLNTSLTGRGAALTSETLRSVHGKQPLTPLKTIPRILWQAARLYYGRGLPFFRRPEPKEYFLRKGGQ